MAISMWVVQLVLMSLDLVHDMAPVGRNQPVARVNDAKGRREAANHSARSVWLTGYLVDGLRENVICWSRPLELQDNLVCPLPYVVDEKLVLEGTLPVPPNGDVADEKLPELEANWRDFYISNHVPGDECVV